MGNLRRATRSASLGFSLIALAAAGAAADPTTITFITRGSWAPYDQQLADLFNAQSTDVKVKVEKVPGGTNPYLERVRVGVAGGEPADVMMIEEGIEVTMAQENQLLDLMPYVQRDHFDVAGYFPGVRQFHVRNDHMYSVSLGTHVQTLQVDEDALAAAGIPLPGRDWSKTWSWTDLRAVGKRLVQTGPDGRMTRSAIRIDKSSDIWLPVLWQYGGRLFSQSADGHTRSALGEPAARDAFTLLQQLYHVDQIATVDGGIDQGTAAMAIDSTLTLGPEFQVKSHWGVYPLPQGPAGPATQSASNGVAILKASAHPEAAWKFLQWLTGPGMPQVVAMSKFGVPPNANYAAQVIRNLFSSVPTEADRLVIFNGLQVSRAKPFLFYGDILSATREFILPAVIDNKTAVESALTQVVDKTNGLLAAAGL
ncbi:MAG TPA: extracellular solute-binding protein [Limnochordia bacterium]|nr:extracellular solute-binding protein [Limnochordia bacterium]